jgi:hypothetical protein
MATTISKEGIYFGAKLSRAVSDDIPELSLRVHGAIRSSKRFVWRLGPDRHLKRPFHQ